VDVERAISFDDLFRRDRPDKMLQRTPRVVGTVGEKRNGVPHFSRSLREVGRRGGGGGRGSSFTQLAVGSSS
jgi:hypothetical protein